jgi:hypothetical protein
VPENAPTFASTFNKVAGIPATKEASIARAVHDQSYRTPTNSELLAPWP